jgi:hypothetical protein
MKKNSNFYDKIFTKLKSINLKIIFILVFCIIGVLTLLITKASTFSINLESDQGNVSGLASVINNDNSVSNGSYVLFGNKTSSSTEAYHTCYPYSFCNSNNQPVLMKGLNIKNVGESPAYTTLSQMTKIKEKGFNMIRLEVHWDVFQPNQGENGYDATAFNNLQNAVTNAKQVGLNVIVDPIHGTNKGDCSGTNGRIPSWAQVVKNGVCQQRIGAINTNSKPYIQKIATLYANEPTVVAIDLANEIQPLNYTDDSELLRMYNQLIVNVREIDKDKILMIEPQGGDKLQKASAIISTITDKSNIVFSSHFYYGGVHDKSGNIISGCTAAGYSSSGIICGNKTYESQAGYVNPMRNDLEAHIKANLDLLADSNIRMPLLVGEYNIPYGQPNANQWLQDMTYLLNKYNIDRTLWSFYNKGYPAGRQCANGFVTTTGGECPETEMSATEWGDSSGSKPGNWKPWVDLLL